MEQSQVLAATIWSLWKHRNLKVCENKNELSAMTVDRARVLIEEWQHANTDILAATHQGAHQQLPDSSLQREGVQMSTTSATYVHNLHW